MELVSHSMLFLSAVCLFVGLLNLRFWFGDRKRLECLAIAFSCFSITLYSWFEITLMNTTSPAGFSSTVRWGHIPAAAAIISIAWFVRIYLRPKRSWLLWTVVGARLLGLAINFTASTNINFREITAISRVSFLGEELSAPIGTPNPWVFVNHIGVLLFLLLCIDGSITAWRRGERRKAWTMGGGAIFFAVATSAISIAWVWGDGHMPIMASAGFFFIVGAMALELNYDMRRTAMLEIDLADRMGKLNEAAQQLDLSAHAADVGIWTRDLAYKEIWASPKWFELYGLEPSNSLTFDEYYRRIHPDEVEAVKEAINASRDSGEQFSLEYRVVLPNNGIRWISSVGRFDNKAGKACFLRGASVDITKRKAAEEEAHELSRKLMGAQEKERARLARELHDDLSQSLALLSINLQALDGKSNRSEKIHKQVGELTSQVQRLSADVHRISHELHPAKLNQLGLVAALRGFCREVSTAHGFKVQFESGKMPNPLPDDVSLCLYRIVQESLQNVAKHSGAGSVSVTIGTVDGRIRLVVSDNGSGFDPASIGNHESLGLVSMSERVRAVKGVLNIDSVIGAGTRIEALVPLPNL